MMEYRIHDTTEITRGNLVENRGGGDYTVMINEQERALKIISMSARGIEFTLDNEYHSVRYIENTTARIEMVVDGVTVRLDAHPGLDHIVYKNSGGREDDDSELALRSQIPGKVVSISVSEGDSVRRGDKIAVLESMKMQVAIKSHKDGTIRSIKIKPGGSVAKNDAIAEIE